MTDLVGRLRARKGGGDDEEVLMREAADEIELLRALLRELIDIEGPQPGTADWAAKVHAALGEP